MILAGLWLACGGGEVAPGAWVTLPEGEPQGLEARFVGAEPWLPNAEQAFEVRGRCPKLTRARAEAGPEGVWFVDVEGERLADVTRVGALLPDGKLADVRFKRKDAVLVLPVACDGCELFFGVEVEGHPVACTGPGRSLKMSKGTPS